MVLINLLIFIFTSLTLYAIPEEPHHTTAFIAPPGTIDNLFTYSTYCTDSFWNKYRKKLPTYNHFNQESYLLYTEYAVNCCNSVAINGGYSMVKESLNGNSRAVEDFELSWKHLLTGSKESALTSQIIGIIPVGDKKSSIRYGQSGLQIGILYSHIFDLWNHFTWIDVELGYRYYRGFPSDQIRSSLALGYVINSYIQVIAGSQLEYGLFNGKSECNLNNVVFHPNYRLLNTQIECVIKIFSHAAISLGAYRHVWGQNVGCGGGYYGGLWVFF